MYTLITNLGVKARDINFGLENNGLDKRDYVFTAAVLLKAGVIMSNTLYQWELKALQTELET